MVNLERLRRLGRRAYEFGRLRVAARTTWLLLPTVLLCAIASGAHEACGCIGVVLLCASIFLRWRDREGVESVRNGLVAGTLPLVAGLITTRLLPHYADSPLLSSSTAVSFVISLGPGLWLGSRLTHQATRAGTWLVTTVIALLTASLGCAALGPGALGGITLGILLGVGVRALLRTLDCPDECSPADEEPVTRARVPTKSKSP